MKRWICLFLVMSSSLAHPNDREHGDFYRGLTGLKAQIDDANKKISEASDAELRELSAQELEQVKRSLQVLNMQDIRMQLQPHLNQLHKSTKSETLLASWMNHVQSSRTKAVKDEAESDLVALREATDRELIELQMNTQRQINSLTERHENDIVRLTQDHKEEVRRLEQLNLDKVQYAETAFENLMGETETQNGLIFKNLAVSIYLRRFLVEDGYDRFFNDLTLTSIDETATVRCDPSILREVISIQEHAILRFEKVKNKLEDAKMLYYEALLDLAFYEAEMSRFGILNVDATQRINENLVAFEQNLLFWLNEANTKHQSGYRVSFFA